ncbi:MAG: hypothetical protein ACI9VR_002769 [Cognaticolwellia sp.]|jgi:hypothetical protein
MRCLPLLLTFWVACDKAEPLDTSTDDTNTPVDQDNDGESAETDCDDTDAEINSSAAEVCDDVDNNCDGEIDEGMTLPFYADADSDSFGDPDVSLQACEPPTGYVADSSDCDDTDPQANPEGTETADDGIDQDCDGDDALSHDEGTLEAWDGVTYGSTGANQCIVVQVDLPSPLTISHLGAAVEVQSSTDLFHLVLYADNANNPEALLASIANTTLVTGENELVLDTPLTLDAGPIWVGVCNEKEYRNGYASEDQWLALGEPGEGFTVRDPYDGAGQTFSVKPTMWVVGY